jgi:ABC-2 type transport system ATP-binding protein
VDEGAVVVFSSHQLDLVERLCDALGIVQAGRMVAVGPVAGSRLESDQGDAAVLALPTGGDEQPLLLTAQSLRAVREFTPVTPTLVELFREVVTDPQAAEGQAA